MKRAIFTFYNHQIDSELVRLHHEVVNKLNTLDNCDFCPLQYKQPDGEMYPDDAMNYGIQHLFYEKNYDTILILEVDCIPFNPYSLEYTFKTAESGILVGDSQRAMHLQNDEHMYVAPSAFCIAKDLYEKLGKISFAPTRRGDIAEEYTYKCEELGNPIEFYMPKHFIRHPRNGYRWDLGKGRSSFGIGTTFVNKNQELMFFHLFESRSHVWNSIFYDKCEEILNMNK
ncbi:MAG: hypothetical protein FJZ57_04890 [Chlamydiae bacterium]|nr:hypothetical protein [Chlamydiota bacterium]